MVDFGNRFAKKSIGVRFKFDTVDAYANVTESWYAGNIVFSEETESAMGSPNYLTEQANTTVNPDTTAPVVIIDTASAPAATI